MIAIIPARGGSKGLPNKNVLKLNGIPLIGYTILAAKGSKEIDRIIVSTDNEEIRQIAIDFGAEVPFLRPKELATDNAKAIDAYLYTMFNLFDEEVLINTNFVVLQPTSPLRTSEDIDNAINIFLKENADSVISVVRAPHPPQWYKIIDETGNLIDFFNDENNLNRQEYNQTYIPNGAIYVFKYNSLKEHQSYYMNRTIPYIMLDLNSIDIDTIMDFKFAELIMKTKQLED